MGDNLDTSNDGRLDASEILDLLKWAEISQNPQDRTPTEQKLRISQIHNIEKMMDLDGSGRVTKREFMNWVCCAMEEAKKVDVASFMKKLFKWLDRDRSKKVDVKELSSVLQSVLKLTNDCMTQPQLVALIASIDEDKDGE